MDINIFLGVAGLILSVVSLVYAVFVTKKSKQEKKLVYEVMSPEPVANLLQGDSAYSLRVVYEQPDTSPIYIEHAFAQYLRFTNFGRIPIQKSDMAEGDALRVEIKGGKILAVTLAGVTRDACKIAVKSLIESNGITSVYLDYDFLDHLDGGIIQILSDHKNIESNLKGTIVGMPEGIEKIDIPESSELPNWGCALVITSFLLSIGAVFYTYKYITGEWTNSWTMLLPFISLIIPFGVLFLITYFLPPRNNFEFPRQLLPPHWYRIRRLTISRYESMASEAEEKNKKASSTPKTG